VSRAVRLYGKKRGNRQVGGGPWGRLLLVLFFSFFLVAGAGFLALLIREVVLPQWRANHRFHETTAVVLQKRIAERHAEDAILYKAEVLLRYTIDSVEYESWATHDSSGSYSSGREAKEAILAGYEVDGEYKAWYDPHEPTTICLARGYDWLSWTMLLLPLTFISVGGGGLIYQFLTWSTSRERRLAMVRRVSDLELFEAEGEQFEELPGVPRDANLRNSPGTVLAYRLPMAVSPGWSLALILMACLFWNGMVALFVSIAVNSHLRGEPEWFLTVFLVPFALMGVALVWYAIRELLVATGIGPTLVEVSIHPLWPGGECEIYVSQAGRLTMNALRVLLVCEEQATFQQGTNSRTETCQVYRQEVLARQDFEIQHALPFEAHAPLRVPADAMHSFKSTHNEVRWKLIVQGDVRGWPNYQREFPLLVYPAEAERRRA
jgi:hypothetical protein